MDFLIHYQSPGLETPGMVNHWIVVTGAPSREAVRAFFLQLMNLSILIELSEVHVPGSHYQRVAYRDLPRL